MQVTLETLYPGCPFERQVLGLEITQLLMIELAPAGEGNVKLGEGKHVRPLAKVHPLLLPGGHLYPN